MKKLTRSLFIALLIVITLVSCHHRYPAALVEADSLLYSNPEMALVKLDSVSSCIDTTKTADIMYLHLLKLMARDKLYLPLGNLDSVQALQKYYEDNDKKQRAKVYYMLGRVFYNMHETTQSFAYFHKVIDELENNQDVRLKGLAYSQVGYLMRDLGDLKEAVNFYRKAYSCFVLVKNVKAMSIIQRDIAILEMSMGQPKVAFELLHEALNNSKMQNDVSLNNDVKLQLANYYLYETNELDSVWYYLSPSLKKSGDLSQSAIDFVASDYYWAMEKEDSTCYFLSKIMQCGDVYDKQEAFRRMMLISSSHNDIDKGLECLDKYIEYGDQIKKMKNKEMRQNGLALFNYVTQKEKIEELKDRNQYKTFGLLSLTLIVLAVMFLLYIYYQMSVVRKLRIRNKINELKLFSLSSDAKNVNRQIEIKKHLSLNRYIEEQKILADEDWKTLDFEVNQLYHKFKEILNCGVKLSDFEYKVCLLVKIGVETKNIALFTAHSKQAVSMAKQRLFCKLTKEKGRAEDFDMLIANL